MRKRFSCVTNCSDCCKEREYYPTEEFGKIGVLLLPNEKPLIENQADLLGLKVRILPRLAIGNSPYKSKAIAYQLMGKNDDGSLCPFLDIDSSNRAPNGGYSCMIYENRPLACRAYPTIGKKGDTAVLDEHCRFCKDSSTNCAQAAGLQPELEALSKISSNIQAAEGDRVWRYATATGSSDAKMFPEGWVAES